MTSYGTQIVAKADTILSMLGAEPIERQPSMQLDVLTRMDAIIDAIGNGGNGGNNGGGNNGLSIIKQLNIGSSGVRVLTTDETNLYMAKINMPFANINVSFLVDGASFEYNREIYVFMKNEGLFDVTISIVGTTADMCGNSFILPVGKVAELSIFLVEPERFSIFKVQE